jgi:RNA polymerase sigma factor (sigma-70 family)
VLDGCDNVGAVTADTPDLAVFEHERTHLRAVAYRLLGSVHEADDAVQEAWLRLQRTDTTAVENLPAWLTTVVSRICLDQLRTRSARREDLDAEVADAPDLRTPDPAGEAEQADAVGRALIVVLDTLPPAERLAFCLHDLFGLSFDEIASVLGRRPAACRQLASRGRRRVQGQGESVATDRVRQREVVTAFLDAARNAKFDKLLSLLHPDAVAVADATAAGNGAPALLSGADEIARFYNGSARALRVMELDGFTGLMWTYLGEIKTVFGFTVEDGRIREIEVLSDDVDRFDLRFGRSIRSGDKTDRP